MSLFEYRCKTCGQTIPGDEWELAAHSLTHGQILATDQPLPVEETDDRP
jgi:tRNA(Ile2) C34 agmatinyltransferase TiaS